MPSPSRFSAIPRRALPIFYILDTSGSMSGIPIERLNRAMSETLDSLKQIAIHNGDAKLKIAVLDFNTKATWLQPAGPEDMEDFFWPGLEAGGLTSMGAALKELNSKLTKDAFLKSSTGSLFPVLIFMTDGYATDDYEAALNEINENRYFRNAVKVGFAIGERPDTDMIAKIVGDREAVIRTEDLGVFAKLIRFVSVTASTSVSKSSSTPEAQVTGRSIVSAVMNKDYTPAQEPVKETPVSSFGAASNPTPHSGTVLLSWDADEW